MRLTLLPTQAATAATATTIYLRTSAATIPFQRKNPIEAISCLKARVNAIATSAKINGDCDACLAHLANAEKESKLSSKKM